jgi:hypothetical protein
MYVVPDFASAGCEANQERALDLGKFRG